MGSNYFFDQVSNHCGDFDLNDPITLIDYAEYLRKEKMQADKKLFKTYAEKSEINAKLKITYEEKAERGVEINKLKRENRKLISEVNNLKKRLEKFESLYIFRLYTYLKRIFKRK